LSRRRRGRASIGAGPLSGRRTRIPRRAAQSIARHFNLLTTMPQMGRPIDAQPEIRELLIPFGDSGYVALYRYEEGEDLLLVLAFRHMREAGY
jgi:plasmid stabilization system protein ParE